jgi:hypothetical protein
MYLKWWNCKKKVLSLEGIEKQGVLMKLCVNRLPGCNYHLLLPRQVAANITKLVSVGITYDLQCAPRPKLCSSGKMDRVQPNHWDPWLYYSNLLIISILQVGKRE